MIDLAQKPCSGRGRSHAASVLFLPFVFRPLVMSPETVSCLFSFSKSEETLMGWEETSESVGNNILHNLRYVLEEEYWL